MIDPGVGTTRCAAGRTTIAAARATAQAIERKNVSTAGLGRRKSERMFARASGTAVAPCSAVRPFFLAWLTLALLLLGMGRLSRAGDDMARAGSATATGHKPVARPPAAHQL